MPKSVPFTEARARLSDLLDQVERSHEHVEITRNGRPAAVLMSPEDYESIVETLEILGDDELVGAVEQSEEDVKSGRLRSWKDVKRDSALAELRLTRSAEEVVEGRQARPRRWLSSD